MIKKVLSFGLFLLFLSQIASASHHRGGVPLGGWSTMNWSGEPFKVTPLSDPVFYPQNHFGQPSAHVFDYNIPPPEPPQIPNYQLNYWSRLAYQEKLDAWKEHKKLLDFYREHTIKQRESREKWDRVFKAKREHDERIERELIERKEKVDTYRKSAEDAIGASDPEAVQVFSDKFSQKEAFDRAAPYMDNPAQKYVEDVILNSDQKYKKIQELPLPDELKKPFLGYVVDSAKAAYDFVDGVGKGVIQGFNKGAVSYEQAMKHIYENPDSLLKVSTAIMNTLTHPEHFGKYLSESFTKVKIICLYGSAAQQGEAFGELASGALIGAAEVSLIGPGASGMLRKLISMHSFQGLGEAVAKGAVNHPVFGGAARNIELEILQGSEGAANSATHERYLKYIRERSQRPHVEHADLKEFLHDFHRDQGVVGNGSPAAAIRAERATGDQVGGRFHTQKGQDGWIYLKRWLHKNPTERLGDRAAAENVIKDLEDALGPETPKDWR